MTTFLCQKVKGEIIYDFVLETVNSVNFANWFNNEEVYKIEYLEDIRKYNGPRNKKVIPVGSVEFVEMFYNKILNVSNITPKNIPEELMAFAKRKVWIGDGDELILVPTFCKSIDRVKGFVSIIDYDQELPKGKYMFSELIDIDSEWRCFVYRSKLISIHNYANSLGPYPDISEIEKMIGSYAEMDSYTLDVGVNGSDGTFIIEIHDFYSCGLYGFRDHIKLLHMMIDSHMYKLKNNKKG